MIVNLGIVSIIHIPITVERPMELSPGIVTLSVTLDSRLKSNDQQIKTVLVTL